MVKQTYKITSELFEQVYNSWYSTTEFVNMLPDAQEFFEQDVCGIQFEHFTTTERVYEIVNSERFAWARIKYGF
jgi:hypothetical protein